ncbi:hypothetical protein [Marinobacterium arenosum]|uniref:hypothetical protein n=1 Tax=Marinobacterium arenosum TaxID=2862496 RepID=UPI001C93C63B|nr:hypothetical protein [Marinobacterium arenosum]MBY4677850.1 hypothetical protein [Marinobacterium arenosum]
MLTCCAAAKARARAGAGRQALIERRGEGVFLIVNRSRELSGRGSEYRLIGDPELLLSIFAASKETEE